eukprot:3540544-Pyramimonas_sp.AAC.1
MRKAEADRSILKSDANMLEMLAPGSAGASSSANPTISRADQPRGLPTRPHSHDNGLVRFL